MTEIAEAAAANPDLLLDYAFALSGMPRFYEWLEKNCPSLSWHWPYLRHIQRQLDRVTVGEIDRLMLFVPPRHGKSTMVTERYPVYYMEQTGCANVIVGSYGLDLARKFSRNSRRLAAEIGLQNGSNLVTEWETIGGGMYKAAGVGTGITGFGGDLMILDDPIKDRKQANSATYRAAVWDWYQDVFSSRLEPGGKLIIILTRWHEDDLAGRLIREHPEEWNEDNIIAFPAIAYEDDALGRKPGEPLCPERYNLRALERIRRNVPESTWFSLYQQRPRPDGGAVYMREWFTDEAGTRYDWSSAAIKNRCIARYLSWDTAFKDNPEADYTACTVFEMTPDYRVIIREVYAKQIKYPELIDTITAFSRQYNYDGKLRGVIIEDKASGISALQDLDESGEPWLRDLLIAYKVDASKVERAQEAAIRCRAGSVLLPHPSERTPWLKDYEDEFFSFPSSLRKDRTDSTTQGILYLRHYLIAGEQGRTHYGVA